MSVDMRMVRTVPSIGYSARYILVNTSNTVHIVGVTGEVLRYSCYWCIVTCQIGSSIPFFQLHAWGLPIWAYMCVLSVLHNFSLSSSHVPCRKAFLNSWGTDLFPARGSQEHSSMLLDDDVASLLSSNVSTLYKMVGTYISTMSKWPSKFRGRLLQTLASPRWPPGAQGKT